MYRHPFSVTMSPVAAPTTTDIAASAATIAANAIKTGRLNEDQQRVFYDRILIDPPAGGLVLTRQSFELFTHQRAQNPELTNLLEAQRMGPSEAFRIEGVALQGNFGCTEAGLVKLLSDARLRIGVGPDDVERLNVPAIFLPSNNGTGAGLINQAHNGFYRLAVGQEINLQAGHPFSVRLIEGPNAGTLADAEIVDVFVKLFGTYAQSVVR